MDSRLRGKDESLRGKDESLRGKDESLRGKDERMKRPWGGGGPAQHHQLAGQPRSDFSGQADKGFPVGG